MIQVSVLGSLKMKVNFEIISLKKVSEDANPKAIVVQTGLEISH